MTEHLWQRAKSVETAPRFYIVVTSVKGKVTSAHPFSDRENALEVAADILDSSDGSVDINLVESILDGL